LQQRFVVVVIFGVLIFGIFEEAVILLLLCYALVPVLFVLAAKDNVPNAMGDTIITTVSKGAAFSKVFRLPYM
jgi:uncharacterized membrane protein YoaK (UPF0700 family)